jgi:hypothetical protein
MERNSKQKLIQLENVALKSSGADPSASCKLVEITGDSEFGLRMTRSGRESMDAWQPSLSGERYIKNQASEIFRLKFA